MINKIINRFTSKIFFKVYAYYAIVLFIFAVLLGIIFINLYNNNTIEIYRNQLEENAKNIAKNLSRYIINAEIDRNGDEYIAYVYLLEEIESSDIWIIRNPTVANPFYNQSMENISLADIGAELPGEIKELLAKAFEGEISSVISFYNIYDVNMMTIGMPIYGSDETIVGAVLLNGFMDAQEKMLHTIQNLILISTGIALFVAYVIAIAFVRKISMPISRMKTTTLELVNGNYEMKTNILLKDEIGELARTIDILSERLLDNASKSESLEQMRRDFFANVSHELRTPITVIRAYTESLLDGVVTDEQKVNQYYDRMLGECKTMERLVGDLLDLSKLQNPDFKIEVEPVNISQIFDDIIRSAKAIGDKKNVSIHIKKDSELCMIMGDYVRLRQMFMVILDNAIKFSHENSNVYISLKISDKLRISIRDEGVGIPEEELPFIFEKFYKSKNRQNASGSGLGLAIANQIAIRLNGKIIVNSTIGKGCEFIFEFDNLKWKEELFLGNI